MARERRYVEQRLLLSSDQPTFRRSELGLGGKRHARGCLHLPCTIPTHTRNASPRRLGGLADCKIHGLSMPGSGKMHVDP